MNGLIELEINQASQQVYEIKTNEDLPKINAVLKGIKQLKKKVEDELNPEIEKAHKAHKGLNDLKNKYLKPLKDVEDKINIELKRWTLKQEEEARLLQEKINKQLAESAEKERQRLLKEAESSNDWKAETLKEKAQEIIAVTVDIKDCKETVAPKVEGQYKRSNWKARITNYEFVPKAYWIVDEKALDEVAKKEKGQIKISGVEFYDDFTIVTKI